jgi:hypothetical protein
VEPSAKGPVNGEYLAAEPVERIGSGDLAQDRSQTSIISGARSKIPGDGTLDDNGLVSTPGVSHTGLVSILGVPKGLVQGKIQGSEHFFWAATATLVQLTVLKSDTLKSEKSSR